MTFKLAVPASLALIMVASPILANDEDQPSRPKVIEDIEACRAISQADLRLACFDAASAALTQAVETRSVVTLDREEVRKTKRSLFGFSMPNLPFFNDDDDDEEEKQALLRLETVFESAEPIGYGKWQFVLPDAGVWQTTEPVRFGLKAGQKVLIKKAAAGGYMIQIGNGGYTRVKRIG